MVYHSLLLKACNLLLRELFYEENNISFVSYFSSPRNTFNELIKSLQADNNISRPALIIKKYQLQNLGHY